MSGGTFDYKQYQINDIIDQIDGIKLRIDLPTNEEINSNGSLKSYFNEPDKIKEELDKALNLLRLSSIYVQRIDWLIAGDDGEDSFHKRLKEELEVYEVSLHK